MIISPEDVGAFRGKLQQLAEELEAQLRRADAAMETVAQEWKDEQFKKFHQQFHEDRNLLMPLRDEITEFQDGPLRMFQENAQSYLDL